MKNYLQFLKEEVDLKGNKGIDDDFMKKAEDQAKQNLGVTPNTNGPVTGDIGSLMNRSAQLLTNGLNTDQIEERYTKLEDLAKRVIMDEYGDIIEASEKPVELLIRLIRPNQSVLGEVPDLLNVPAESEEKPSYSEEEETEAQTPQGQTQGQPQGQPQGQEETEEQEEQKDDFMSFFDDDTDYEDQEEENPEEVEALTNKDVAMAIDKKKILNMLTQGEGKATKDIIKFSEVVESGLREILGDSYRELLDVWIKTSEIAHKMDWAVTDKSKGSMMKNMPGGLAGAAKVTWENTTSKFNNIELLTENTDFNKIVIRAYGIDFPMLLHEAIKGIYLLLQSSAIKKDNEIAEEIKRATSSFKDESQDFKYGVVAQNMFRDFINACKDANKYKQMRARVFAQLAVDKPSRKSTFDKKTPTSDAVVFTPNVPEMVDILYISSIDKSNWRWKESGATASGTYVKGAGGRYTDEEFLEITKSLFSVFDSKNETGKISFVINQSRFEESKAKSEIEKIIADIVKAEDEYRDELNKWEMEQRFGNNEPEPQGEGDESHPEQGEESQSDIDRLVKQSLENPDSQEDDESNLSKREIQELIDDALDADDYDEVDRLAHLPNYLKEGLVYLAELKRINESKIRRRR
jgi:hypothetical protein